MTAIIASRKKAVWLSALVLSFAAAGAAERDGLSPPPKGLTAAARGRIDKLALARPAETLTQETLAAIEDFPARAWARIGPDAAEEARRATEMQEALLADHAAAPTPRIAENVFGRLLEAMPPHLKPEAFHFSLTVLDRPGCNAFTWGGGRVYITRPYVDALLADQERGEGALAFVLAVELGRGARGHTRRGWQRRECQEEIGASLPARLVPGVVREAVAPARPGRFVYTPAEQTEADIFALHLCRNAGFDQDHALDSLRLAASGEDPPPGLDRLKRLLMERDGLFNEEKFGLYLWDHKTGRQKRCTPGAVGAGERPVIFVHGLRANGAAFGTYLDLFGAQKDFADRPIMVFRYPNNESLSRCGELLTNEVKRTIAEPEKADFVCHSAGGLVFRWYAEVRHGAFHHAVIMATPHEGSNLANEKELVDCGRFLIDLPMGLSYTFDDAFGEGDGEIANDLHPDSLFLRRLGHDARLAARYHVFYGVFFDLRQELTLRVGFTLVKAEVHDAVETYIPFPDLKQRVLRLVDAATLPEEIAHGDLIVSARSASLADAGRTTRANLMHEAFRFDPAVMRQVLASLRGEE